MLQINEYQMIKENGGGVTEVSEDFFDAAMGEVPPIYGRNCVAMGEIASHTGAGEAVYYWFGMIPKGNGNHRQCRCYAFYGTIGKAEKIFDAIKGNTAELH